MKRLIRLAFFFLWVPLGLWAQGANLSPAAEGVLKLSQAGVGDLVILAYVQSVKTPFDLNVDGILELRNDKVSDPVITAMLDHDVLPKSKSQTNTAQLNPNPSALPAPLAEVVPVSPGSGYIWVPGSWVWENGWVWLRGQWVPPPVWFGWEGWHPWHRWHNRDDDGWHRW
jgi:hypothetical protein